MRTYSTAALAALDKGEFGVRAFLKMMPAGDDPLCLWDDLGDFEVNGDVYVGRPGAFVIEPTVSTIDLSIREMTITFSGLDDEVVNFLETVNWHQRPVQVMRGVFAIDTPTVIHVESEFVGFMDKAVWTEAAGPDQKSSLVVTCESAARELSMSGARTASDADQRQLDASDGFFSFATSAVTKEIEWGRTVTAPERPRGITGLLDRIF